MSDLPPITPELLEAQKALIDEVQGTGMRKPPLEQVIAWLDKHCLNWRNGPAPRGTPLIVVSNDKNDPESEEE